MNFTPLLNLLGLEDSANADYQKTNGKITQIKTNKGTTSFKYDKDGKLINVSDSNGRCVMLVYNSKGLITGMYICENDKRLSLTFKYNSQGKPIEIAVNSDNSTEKLNITYDNNGEIKKVESSSGSKIALQVTSAFQLLLDLIRPANLTN